MKRPWQKIITEAHYEDGSVAICVSLPNPVAGNPPILFKTGQLPAQKRDWARRQAEIEAFRRLDKARGLHLNPGHITYLHDMAA